MRLQYLEIYKLWFAERKHNSRRYQLPFFIKEDMCEEAAYDFAIRLTL